MSRTPARCRLPGLILGLATAGAAVSAHGDARSATPQMDPWAMLRQLEGSWRGEVSGRLGQGSGVRRYEFLYDERYLVARHSSVRLPQPQSPQGDRHRELAVYSYDRERETLVLREFNIEGYVLQYTCQAQAQAQAQAQRLICTSESIEGGAGMRARLTLTIENPYRFEEFFELAAPGEALSHYLTVHWTREPDLND